MQGAHLEWIKAYETPIKVFQAANFKDDPLWAFGQQVVEVIVPFVEFIYILKHNFNDQEIFIAAINDAEHVLALWGLASRVDGNH